MSNQNKKEESKKLRKYAYGIVQNVKDEKTCRVRVEKKFAHPKYGKIIKKHRNYVVHIPEGTVVEPGEEVKIGEIRPISKLKTWEIVK